MKQREDRVSVAECETRDPQTRILASKRETRVLPVLERDFRVSNTEHDGSVQRHIQSTLEVCISTLREVRVSAKKHEAHVQNGMSLRQKEPNSPHPMGLRLVLQMPRSKPERLPDKEEEYPLNYSLMSLRVAHLSSAF